MRKLVTIKFGSHLYGTSTPASDVDLKSIFVPAARDILLQRVKASVSTKRAKAEKEKNYAGEIDEESYSLQRYLGLAAEGQTVALDVLFAPEWSMIEPPSAEWREIMANRPRLLTRKSAAFVGYCRQQANKYGIKGSRIAAAREALGLLETAIAEHGTTAKLSALDAVIRGAVADAEHMSIDQITQAGGTVIDYWNVCGRKLQFTATIKHARDVIASLVNEYGQRALQAESQQGVDWKALSHAVRVATQAIELLQTGNVTFPLPNAAHILEIKIGQLPYQAVSAEIEDLLVAVETEAARSPLPQEPDHKWIEAFIFDVYGRAASPASLIERAKAFATAAHATVKQVRKYTGEPYINHPAAVVKIVESVPHTPEMVAAAWLHDVVEDTGVTLETIKAEFGPTVSDLVFWLTDQSKPGDGNRALRKGIDRNHSASAPPDAQTVKLADLIDNTLTIEALDPDFARVYQHEKRRLLDVMTAGEPSLMARALEQMTRFSSTIEHCAVGHDVVSTFFQDFKRDDGTDVTVEYFYEDHGTGACIKEAWRSEDVEGTELLELTDAEHERMTAWIMEHRSQDDRTDPG